MDKVTATIEKRALSCRAKEVFVIIMNMNDLGWIVSKRAILD
jgi:hypothetical protein